MATFKTYRTPTGAHVHVNEAYGSKQKGWTELQVDALDANGAPLAPYYPIKRDLNPEAGKTQPPPGGKPTPPAGNDPKN